MKNLLMVERMILESCSRSNVTIFSMSQDTGLSLNIVSAICNRLMRKGILLRKANSYIIDQKGLNSYVNIKAEVREVSNAIIDNYFSDSDSKSLKLQKIYITDSEEKILNSLFNQLNTFVLGIRQSNLENKELETRKQRVIMWGHGKYNDLIETSLKRAN